MDRQQWEAQQRAAKAHGKRRRTAEDPDGPWGGIEVVEDIDVDGWEQYEQAQGVGGVRLRTLSEPHLGSEIRSRLQNSEPRCRFGATAGPAPKDGAGLHRLLAQTPHHS